MLRSLLSHTLRHLGRWMKPRKCPRRWCCSPPRPGFARQPLGVVGVISPWNYPVQLALAPAIHRVGSRQPGHAQTQ